jgi:hypothetical protein
VGMDIAARTSQLFEIFESQEFDGLESLLAADAKMKQNGNPEHGVAGLMAFVKGFHFGATGRCYQGNQRSR